jgi:BMFP domain-containing protein YqiC
MTGAQESGPSLDWRPAKDWPIPPMDHAPGAKSSAFTWAMGRLILQRMGDRETMKAITADPRMPAYCTVFRWVQVIPAFGDAYRQVRAALAVVMREEDDALRAARARAKGPPRRHWVSGRRSSYTPRLARAVCEAIAAGASVSEVVARPGMPSFKVLYGWVRTKPDFRAMFIDAGVWRECGLEALIGEAMDTVTPETLAQARARVAALEARIGRLTPKRYRSALPRVT